MALNDFDKNLIIDKFISMYSNKKLKDYTLYDFIANQNIDDENLYDLKIELENKGYIFIDDSIDDDSLYELEVENIKESISKENRGDKLTQSQKSLNDYYKSVEKYKLLTDEQEKTLLNTYLNGTSEIARNRAQNKFIYSNWRLVMKYAHEFKNNGVELIDLINAGNLGLARALKTYDPKKGKFSTYASQFIKKNIHKVIRENNIIHIPELISDSLFKIKKYTAKYKEKYCKNPSSEELSKFMNLDGIQLSASQIEKNSILLGGCSSIDNMVYNDEGDVVNNGIEDRNVESPTDYSDSSEVEQRLNEAIKNLPILEQTILLQYIKENKTFLQIKQDLGLTISTEAIRIKYKTACHKVKTYVNSTKE